MREQTIPETHQSALPNSRQSLESRLAISTISEFAQVLAYTATMRTCIRGRCAGRVSTSILRKPTPIAPEETMMTRCPSLRSLAVVSTMRVRMDKMGSCVTSSTIELVPFSLIQTISFLSRRAIKRMVSRLFFLKNTHRV